MSDNGKATPESLVRGPKRPPGLLTIQPWVRFGRPALVAVAIGGMVFFFTHPLHVTTTRDPGKLSSNVSAVDASELVAKPAVTFAPIVRPTPRATPYVSADDADTSVRDTVAVATPIPAGVPENPVATAPPTESPAHIAARQRAEEDRAALSAPLPSTKQVAAVANPDDPATYDTAPPPGTFLEPGRKIDLILETSIDSTVQGSELGAITAHTGSQPVLDFFRRVVLIPPFTEALGHLTSCSLAPGQKRIGAVWDAFLLTNGHMIKLNAPGIDRTGTLGLGATIDEHTRKALASALAFSVLAAGAQLAQPRNQNYGDYGSPNVGQSIGQAFGTQLSTLAASTYGRAENEQPTAHVVEGAAVALTLTNYLPMKEWRP